MDKPEAGAPFLLTISRQESADRQVKVKKASVTLSESEAAILEAALEKAILRILAWKKQTEPTFLAPQNPDGVGLEGNLGNPWKALGNFVPNPILS